MNQRFEVRFSIGLVFLFCSIIGYSQEWVDMMNQPKGQNFFEIQKSFEKYWEGKDIPRGKGYKPFKRWEYYWENRVYKDGSFPPAGIAQIEFDKYLKNKNNTANRSMPAANWLSEGPSSTNGGYAGLGRCMSFGFHPTDTDIIYVGTAGGGLWQTTNGGTTWFTNTDDLGSLGVSAIVVDQVDPSIVYIATGDADAGDNYSTGVLKSTDGGGSFSATGLNWSTSSFNLIRRLINDPDDRTILIAATNNGIYRTTNSGTNWTQVATGNFYDLEPNFDSASNTFYACTSNEVFKSTDNGVTWTSQQSFSGVNRTALATTPDNTNYVYALCSNSSDNGFKAFYRSTNSGTSFSQRSNSPNIMGWSNTGNDSGGQGWYDLALVADPQDAEIVYMGGVNNWKSTDGGSSWSITSHWSGSGGVQAVHADKHALEFQGTVLWEANDGGVYKTTNAGSSWQHKGSGIINSQMYDLGVAQTNTSVITGLQDNGTKLKNAAGTWTDELGGDGMQCAINPFDADVMYGSVYYGEFSRSTNGGSNWTNISSNLPGCSANCPTGAWVTPFTLDSLNSTTLYIGMKELYKSTNQGNTWTTISSGQSSSNLSYVNIAPSDSDYIYMGRSNQLWRTTNGGTSWSTMTTPGSGTVKLAVHPTDPNTLWAVRSNYSAGAKVYKSTNGGATWTNESGTLPNIPANTIVYQSGSANGIYVGMDIGVYYKDDGMADWELFADGIPNVEITDLEINYDAGLIYAATYGRGLWRSELRDQIPTCFYPLSGVVDSQGLGTASVSWTDPTTAPSNGYEYVLSTSTTSPTGSGTPTTLSTASFSNLTYGTDYFVHVRSNCGGTDFSGWITIGPIRSLPTCGDTFYDTGGASGNYDDNQDVAVSLCPENSMNRVTATFNSFDIESDWDALYVYNGPDTNSSLIASANGSTQAGFPAGGYYGTSIPGPFVSSDPTGCLTLRLMSDTYVTGTGWDVDISCDLHCSPPELDTKLDTGYGSLRHVIACPLTSAIVVNGIVANDTINITGDALEIWQDVIIDQILSEKVIIKSTLAGPLFNIQSGKTLQMDNVDIIVPDNNAVFNNNGTIEVQDATIKGNNLQIQNNNSIKILPNGTLKIIEN